MNDSEAVAFEPLHRELDLTVGQRLAIGFGTLLLVLFVFAIAVFVWHSQSAAAQRAYTDRIAPLAHKADALERSMLYVGIAMRSYLLVPEPGRLESYRNYVAQSQRALADLSGTSRLPEGAPDVEEIAATSRAYLDETNRLVTKRADGKLGPEDENNVVTLRERSLSSVHRLIDLQTVETERALDRMSTARDKMSTGLIALSLIAGLLSIGIAWFTAQSIRRPTRSLLRAAGAMERGDWKPALHLAPSEGELGTSRSEMRKLAHALGSAATAIEQRERELREKNRRIQSQNEELRAQNEQIQAQNEELRTQNEQIQSQNEELHAQNEEIQSQSEEIHAQSEELQLQSEELHSRTKN